MLKGKPKFLVVVVVVVVPTSSSPLVVVLALTRVVATLLLPRQPDLVCVHLIPQLLSCLVTTVAEHVLPGLISQ